MNYNDYMKEMEMQQQAKSRNPATMPQYIYPPQPPMRNTTLGQMAAPFRSQPVSPPITAQNPARPPNGTLIQDPVTGRVFREGDMIMQSLDITDAHGRAVKAWIDGYRYEPPTPGQMGGGMDFSSTMRANPNQGKGINKPRPMPPEGTELTDPVTGRKFKAGQMLFQVKWMTDSYARAVDAWANNPDRSTDWWKNAGDGDPMLTPPKIRLLTTPTYDIKTQPATSPTPPSRSVRWEGPGNPFWEKRMGLGQRGM